MKDGVLCIVYEYMDILMLYTLYAVKLIAYLWRVVTRIVRMTQSNAQPAARLYFVLCYTFYLYKY